MAFNIACPNCRELVGIRNEEKLITDLPAVQKGDMVEITCVCGYLILFPAVLEKPEKLEFKKVEKKKEIKNCPECQFENGKHSFECSQYKETKFKK